MVRECTSIKSNISILGESKIFKDRSTFLFVTFDSWAWPLNHLGKTY